MTILYYSVDMAYIYFISITSILTILLSPSYGTTLSQVTMRTLRGEKSGNWEKWPCTATAAFSNITGSDVSLKEIGRDIVVNRHCCYTIDIGTDFKRTHTNVPFLHY